VQVRDLAPQEGVMLLGIVRRGSGSVVRGTAQTLVDAMTYEWKGSPWWCGIRESFDIFEWCFNGCG
jgi:hypothetical protein